MAIGQSDIFYIIFKFYRIEENLENQHWASNASISQLIFVINYRI